MAHVPVHLDVQTKHLSYLEQFSAVLLKKELGQVFRFLANTLKNASLPRTTSKELPENGHVCHPLACCELPLHCNVVLQDFRLVGQPLKDE